MQIELEPQQLDYLLQVLATRPLGEALPLFESLRQQAAQEHRAQLHAIPPAQPGQASNG